MTEAVAADRARVLLVCRDSAARGRGPDGRMSLAKAPRGELGVVDSGCLGVCPRQRVVALDAARPGRWLVTRAGTDPVALLAATGESAAAPPAPASLADWRALLRPAAEQDQA